LKKISKKQQKVKKELGKIYLELLDERGHYCTGCGRSGVPLSHSHLIPRSRRPDLVTEKRNITYHCLIGHNDSAGCHQIWEGVKRYKLLDYHKNMEYILEADTEYYFLINNETWIKG